MTLEFRPPFEINPNAPSQMQKSLATLGQTANNIGNDWTQYGQQQRENKIQQAMMALRQRQDQREQGAYNYDYGDPNASGGNGGGTPNAAPSPSGSLPNGTMGPQPMSAPGHDQPMSYADNVPSSYQTPRPSYPQMADAGTPDTGWPSAAPQMPQYAQPESPQLQSPQPMHQPGTDLTSHFQSWRSQGQPPQYDHPELGGKGQGQGQGANNPMDRYSQIMALPGAKRRAEAMALFKEQGTEGMQQSEANKNNAMANFYNNTKGQASSLALGEKKDQYSQKRLTALGDALDPSKARAGAFGVSKQVYDRAERLQSLASAFKDGNLDSRQVEELAIGLNAMLSGANTGAAQQVKSLVPNSIWGNAQKVKEWLVNEPQGLQQQAFVNRMLGSITREKSTASDQLKRTQFQRIGRYGDLEKSNPDEFQNVLQSSGVDPQEYSKWKKGGYKPMTAVQSPEGDQSGGKIRVSNGKETLLIDPSDAADAAKDGYQ